MRAAWDLYDEPAPAGLYIATVSRRLHVPHVMNLSMHKWSGDE